VVVVGVDCTLAPELRFLARPDDVVEAVHWIAENIADFGRRPGSLRLAGAFAAAIRLSP
jgi:acetyl esterase/lipase